MQSPLGWAIRPRKCPAKASGRLVKGKTAPRLLGRGLFSVVLPRDRCRPSDVSSTKTTRPRARLLVAYLGYLALVRISQVRPPLRDLKKYNPSGISLFSGKYVAT